MAYLRNRYENDAFSGRYSTQEPSLHQTSLRERSQPLGHIHVKGQLNMRLPAIRQNNINKASRDELIYGYMLDVGETRLMMLDWNQDDPVFVCRNTMRPSTNNVFTETIPTLFASGNGMDLSNLRKVEIAGATYLDQDQFEDGLLFAGWATHNVSYRSPGTTASIAICGLRTVWIAGTDGDWGDRFGWCWPNVNKSIRDSEAKYERPLNDRPREKIMARIERMDPSDVVRMPQRALTAAFTPEQNNTKKGILAENGYNPYAIFKTMNGSRSENKYLSSNDNMVAGIARFAQWCAILGGKAVLSKTLPVKTSAQILFSTARVARVTRVARAAQIVRHAQAKLTSLKIELPIQIQRAKLIATTQAIVQIATTAAEIATQVATQAEIITQEVVEVVAAVQAAANVAAQAATQAAQAAAAEVAKAQAAAQTAAQAAAQEAAKAQAAAKVATQAVAKAQASQIVITTIYAAEETIDAAEETTHAANAAINEVLVTIQHALVAEEYTITAIIEAAAPDVLEAAVASSVTLQTPTANSLLTTSAHILGISTDKSSVGALSSDEMRDLLGNAVKGLFTTTDLQDQYKIPIKDLEDAQNNAATALFGALNSAAQHYNDRCVGRLVQRGFAWGKADIHM